LTSVELIAAACAACLFVGVLLAVNGLQWFRLRDQQKHYEGMLEQQQKQHEEKVKELQNAHAKRVEGIGALLQKLPKRKEDRVKE